jgi:hypothetical protein
MALKTNTMLYGGDPPPSPTPAPEPAPPADYPASEPPSMDWLKRELLAYAEAYGVEVDESDTKSEVLAAIERQGD